MFGCRLHLLIGSLALCSVYSLSPAVSATLDQPPPFHIGSKFSRTVQKVTGLNWLAGFVAGRVAENQLHRRLGKGNIHVKVNTYSMTDLVAGKVSHVDLRLSQCFVKQFPIGDIHVFTAGPVWLDPGWHHRKSGLRNPVCLNIHANLDATEVAKMLQTPKMASALRGLKLDLPGLGAQQLQVIDPHVELGDNLIKIHATLITEGGAPETGVPIDISGRPEFVGAKLYLRDMNVFSPAIENPKEFTHFADELLNPIADLGRYDRKDHAFRVQDIGIMPDTARAEGTLVLAPKPGMQIAQSQSPRRKLFRIF